MISIMQPLQSVQMPIIKYKEYKLLYINLYVKQVPKKNSCRKKIDPPLSPGTRKYVESVLRRKKLIPYKPYVRKKTHRINTRDMQKHD